MLTPSLDPMIRATLLPVMMMLRAAWENWVPQHVIAYGRTSCDAVRWSQVKGPFSAVRLTLERVGWQVIDATTWRTHEGDDIDVFELGPWSVKRILLRAVQAWQWREVSKGPGLEHLASGGVIEPLITMTTTGAVSRNGATTPTCSA